jgi:formate-dependent nitrite reductase membrane component NrfD
MEGIVFNRVWGMPIAVEMTLLSVASFAAVWAFYFWSKGAPRAALAGGLVATLLPIGSLGILALDLLKPFSGFLVFPVVNPSVNLGSWMVWGGLAIGGFIAASASFTFLLRAALSDRPVKAGLIRGAGLVAATLGVFLAVYPGQLMAAERGIAFWHSAAVPIIALLMGAVGGTAVYALFQRPVGTWLSAATVSLIVVYLLHLSSSGTGPRVAAVSAAVTTQHWGFVAGTVLALTATILGLVTRRQSPRWIGPVAGVAAMAAVFTLRLALLEAGAWEVATPLY